MAVNLSKNRLALLTAYQDVINETSATDWDGRGDGLSVNLSAVYCVLISIFCTRRKRYLCYNNYFRLYQHFVLRICFFCMALVFVDPVQDSVSDLFVLKRNC
ncbi:hypothetical protein PO909_008455 [Leuciscus waleckii]